MKRTHTHPDPQKWANFLSIVGVDKGVFSTVTHQGETWTVAFENGVTVEVVKGPLQNTYTL